MPYFREATYRDKEQSWREKADNLSPGAERDACMKLADGYAALLLLLERLDKDEYSIGVPAVHTER
jgi:hypothetical protein